MTDASARLAHHLTGLQAAFRELYPTGEILIFGHHQGNESADLTDRFVSGTLDGGFSVAMKTSPFEGLAKVINDEARKRGILK